jgi:mannitol/fructose-specific phosphotransferase system IIA component (Ntr-type)
VTTLARYTSTGLIIPQLRNHGPAAVLGELCSALGREGRVEDVLAFYNMAMSQEQVSHNAVPPGWALPYACVKGLSRLTFALGRSEEGLDWFGGQKVRLVFLFAVPETEAALHSRLLGALARLGQDPLRLEALFEASDSHAIFEVLQRIRLRPASSVAAPLV